MSIALYGAHKGASAVFRGAVTGTLTLTPTAAGRTLVRGTLRNLSPGMHGLHIHAAGDISGDSCANTGAHYNPGNAHHGGASGPERHAGDLGNVRAAADGTAVLNVTVAMDVSDVAGRSVVVHALEDDLGQRGDEASLANGNSGARIACAVISKVGGTQVVAGSRTWA